MCCLQGLPEVVPENLAAEFLKQMAQPDLVFLTNANKNQLEGEARAKLEAIDEARRQAESTEGINPAELTQ